LLLDNEAVIHDVRVYLAAQGLGTISPKTLCQHVNNMILPALGHDGTITESTAQRWLKYKLGYECKEAKKGVYMDGHEHLDVIEERREFIEQITNRYQL
jgi:ribulose 1,5-bisphosphate synthetase/thiazole synthase